jgi:hypothetical protein
MISDLRPLISDKAIVDWLELREIFAAHSFTRSQAQTLWQCTQSTAFRRLQALTDLHLLTAIQKGSGPGNISVYVVQGV